MFIKYIAGVAFGGGLGLVLGAFVPSVLRYIKSVWLKETTYIKTALVTEAKAVHTAINTEAENVAKKI